jgi:hypothetical protein
MCTQMSTSSLVLLSSLPLVSSGTFLRRHVVALLLVYRFSMRVRTEIDED